MNKCCKNCGYCECDKSYTYPYKCTESGRRMTEDSADRKWCEKWKEKATRQQTSGYGF